MDLLDHAPIAPREERPSYLTAPDGRALYYRIEGLTDRTVGMVWFVEGIAIQSAPTYPRLAAALRERNLALAYFHPRGAGYSDGVRGDAADFGDVLRDFDGFAEFLAARFPRLPVVQLGHSAGGAFALEIAATHPPAALVLVNPAFRFRREAGPSARDLAKLGVSFLFRRAAPIIDLAGDPARLRDPFDREEGFSLVRDPLAVHRFSVRYLLGLRRVMKRCVENARHVRAPLLFVQGGRDEVIDGGGGAEILGAYAGDATRILVTERGHGSAVIEARATEIADWIAARAR